MSPDRRTDQQARDRIDELNDSVNKRLDAIAAAYETHNDTVTWILRAFVVLLIVGGLIFTYQLGVNNNTGKRNQQAIRVGCILLSNAIVESGAGSGTTNVRRTELFIAAARRAMTDAERKEFDSIGPPTPATLTFPDCEQISKHPDRVQARPLTPPKKK